MHIFISLVSIFFLKKCSVCCVCATTAVVTKTNPPKKTLLLPQNKPIQKKDSPVGLWDGLRVAVNRRMMGWMNWPSDRMDRGMDLREASLNIPSTETVRPTEASFHPPSDFRGSFIRPASGANRIQGKPTKRMDLREASFVGFTMTGWMDGFRGSRPNGWI